LQIKGIREREKTLKLHNPRKKKIQNQRKKNKNMHNLTKKMNVSIFNGRRRFKSKKEKEEQEQANPNTRRKKKKIPIQEKKKLMICNPREKHNIDGVICYGLHHENYVQENYKFHYTWTTILHICRSDNMMLHTYLEYTSSQQIKLIARESNHKINLLEYTNTTPNGAFGCKITFGGFNI